LERVQKWVRRRPAIAALGATASLLLMVVAIGSPIAAFRIAAASKAEAEQRKLAVRTANELRGTLYASEMNLAHQAVEMDYLGQAREFADCRIPAPSVPYPFIRMVSGLPSVASGISGSWFGTARHYSPSPIWLLVRTKLLPPFRQKGTSSSWLLTNG
jgi:hypothetical protein